MLLCAWSLTAGAIAPAWAQGALSNSVLHGYERTSSEPTSAPPLANTTADAVCPAGKFVLGGGFRSNSADLILIESRPKDDATWSVRLHNKNPTGTGTFTAYAICACAGECGPTCLTPPAGLIAWWPADGNVEDVAGARNGTAFGSPTFEDGKVGQALRFDGIDDYVSVPPLGYTTGDKLTVNLWFVSPANCSTDLTQPVRTLLRIDKAFSLRRNRANCDLLDVHFDHDASGFALSAILVPFTPGTWANVTATLDGESGVVAAYLDGELIDETSATGPSSNWAECVNNSPIEANIGRNHTGCIDPISAGHYLGQIDEVAIFDRILNVEEIASLHAAAGAGMCEP